MTKIMFVCHGNICRSPMAEFVMKHMVNKHGVSGDVYIASSATSYEEIGNTVHSGTKRVLSEMGIPFCDREAVRLKKSDYNEYDYIITMDDNNIRNVLNIVGKDVDNKVYKLLDFCGGGSISDPWYTGDFSITYEDVLRGCAALMEKLLADL